MRHEEAKKIKAALQAASAAYIEAAEMERVQPYGSVHNVYAMVKEAYSIEGKARNLSRRWGIDSCNCA